MDAAEVLREGAAPAIARFAAAVKVGTIRRAKGLEFKQVLVAHTPARLVGPAAVPESGQDAGGASRDGAARAVRSDDPCAGRALGGCGAGVADEVRDLAVPLGPIAVVASMPCRPPAPRRSQVAGRRDRGGGAVRTTSQRVRGRRRNLLRQEELVHVVHPE